MHPAARIACLLVFAGFLPTVSPTLGIAIALLSVIGHLLFLRATLNVFVASVWRLKWLYLAILILYLGFTPGRSIIPGFEQPSAEGLLEGVYRIAVLVAILAAVHFVMAVTTREQLCDGILWLLRPLEWFGLERYRTAARLSLTLDYVVDAEGMLKQAIKRRGEDGLVAVTAGMVEQIEQRVSDVDRFVVDHSPQALRLSDVLAPLFLAGAFLVVAQVL